MGGSKFERVIAAAEPPCGKGKVKRHIFTCGKFYYDLLAELKAKGYQDVAISRLEQIAPFPHDVICDELARFPEAQIIWAQEEPKNMGCWSYVEPRFYTALRKLDDQRGKGRGLASWSTSSPPKDVMYVGRKAAASPATGFPKLHKAQNDEILGDAFTGCST